MISLNTDPRLYECETGWSWSPPLLKDYDYWLVLSGRGVLVRNQLAHDLKGGVCFVLRPGDRIEARHDPARCLRVFSFHFSATRPPLPPAEKLPVFRRLEDMALLEVLTREAEWPLSVHGGQACRAMLAAGMLLSLQADPAAESTDGTDRIEACARRLRNSPGRSVGIAELARECGMSEGHFSRRFKELIGLSPSRFRTLARIDRARHLLRESPLPLAAIAEATGFHDEMHFSRVFKAETGMPPGRFRRKRLS
ncbi:MAG: helix-turn-helix domain-containing protein [Verrucomicrobia bacterium]|nr:helix-turn-helix domain-containing protein [Verrucomicrobiota bacterium]MCH8511916.1 AraC family transcriptional regulator [Kiritimatiellia bacterium]